MNYVLVRRNGTEKIQLQNLVGVVSHKGELSTSRRDWTYVEDIKNATLFDSARLAEQVRDSYCRFTWICFRPLSEDENERVKFHQVGAARRNPFT